jgi:hypothetical protein
MAWQPQSPGRLSPTVEPRLEIYAIVVSLGTSMPAALAAQAGPETSSKGTDFQSWEELDVLTRLTSRLDLTWTARLRPRVSQHDRALD